jgi:electron transfer flavoprotein alpha subunit
MAILVYTENFDGKFKKSTYELISYGKEIAKVENSEVVAVTIGTVDAGVLNELSKYGASKIISVKNAELNDFSSQAHASAIVQAAKKVNADVVIFANNPNGKAISSRVAVKMDAGLVPAAVGIPSSLAPFTVRKKAFSGKAFADMVITSDVKVLTLTQNSFKVIEAPVTAVLEDFNAEISADMFGAKPVEVVKTTGKLSVTDAEILVSGGRGLKGPENWGMVEEMAEILGAATCCSRPVTDLDWRPHHEHVGQTGKVVAPNLYIAIGISGAVQHLAGVNGSKVMIVINTDKDAPFFESANYGIVGDAFDVVPKLNAAFKKFKAGN